MKNKINLKESTATNYKYIYDKHIRDNIGRLKIADINASKMEKFYSDLIKKKGFQPVSVDGIHTVLNPVFVKAERDILFVETRVRVQWQKFVNFQNGKGPRKLRV